MKCNVDVVRIRENSIQLNGWAIGKTPETEITYQVEDGAHQPIRFQYVATRRDDVSQIYFGRTVEKELGFDIQFPYERGKDYYLIAKGEGRKIRIKYNEELIRKRSSVAHKRMQKIRDLMNMETVRVCLDFWKENGLKALLVKSKHKLQGIDNDYDYGEWYSLTKPTAEELEEQRKKVFDAPVKFSIVIPAFKTPERFLREMLDSIAEQTYVNWEVCVADGSPAGQSCERVLEQYAKKDSRFKYVILGENKGISGNTNAAMDMATGDYIVLADHDDKLTPNALYECAKLLQEHPGCDCFYSDEDKLDMDGGALFDPHFKPDFNIDLLCSVIILRSVRNTTERRIMTSFSVVRRRRRRSAISRRCCITGAATRIRQRATRRASCTHLMRVRARSWIIINASVSRRSAWKKVWTTAFITLYIKFRGNRWYRSSFRIRITIRIWIYACGRLRRGQRTAMLSLSL